MSTIFVFYYFKKANILYLLKLFMYPADNISTLMSTLLESHIRGADNVEKTRLAEKSFSL